MQIESGDVFMTRLVWDLAKQARDFVRPRIQSKVLARSLKVGKKRNSVRGRTHIGYVEIPHYWAVYYHDGHGPVRARPGKYIVYFKKGKKHLDPRMQVGTWYPVRSYQEKKLSKAQFFAALKRGDIVVTKKSGPAKGKHFFTRGMRGFIQKADSYVMSEVKKWIDATVDLGPRTRKIEIARGVMTFSR